MYNITPRNRRKTFARTVNYKFINLQHLTNNLHSVISISTKVVETIPFRGKTNGFSPAGRMVYYELQGALEFVARTSGDFATFSQGQTVA